MSNANKEARAQYMLDEADVVAFLQQHPEFLQQHPEVLASLELRHDSGTAASLIERQVVLLRDQNRELHARLNGFVETARGNEQRVNQFNTLARALIAAGNTEELVA
ncbi:MAG TPA: DUF484 family protein, partial [Salinisphaeraceae bacterium]|nr:DUF484 family protein [Salinisphaeraceae bacterium]